MARLYRQGDILLRRIDELPKKVEKVQGDILAEGEATGHHHRLVGQVQIYETEAKQRIIDVAGQSAMLVHEEHKPIELKSGVYEVIREREFNPFDQGTRAVLD